MPLWLFKDILSSIEYQLKLFIKEKNDEIEPDSIEIIMADMYDRDAIRIGLRAWAKKKKEYAGINKDVSRKMIFEVRFKPPGSYYMGKTPEQMMKEIMGKLEIRGEE